MGQLHVKALQADERLAVYANKDLMGGTPPAVVVKKGTKQMVFRVDARERVQSGDWTLNDPGDEAGRVERTQRAAQTSFNLTDVPGISRRTADIFLSAGFGSLEALRAATVDDLTSVDGIGTKYAQCVLIYVQERYPDPDAVPDDPGAEMQADLDIGESEE